MTRWEYRTYKFEPSGWAGGKVDELALERTLNDLGLQAWEVTGVIETNSGYGQSKHVVILLKRPLL